MKPSKPSLRTIPLHRRNEISAMLGGFDQLEQQRRKYFDRSTLTGVNNSGVSTIPPSPTASVKASRWKPLLRGRPP
jgi:hypothetical protein